MAARVLEAIPVLMAGQQPYIELCKYCYKNPCMWELGKQGPVQYEDVEQTCILALLETQLVIIVSFNGSSWHQYRGKLDLLEPDSLDENKMHQFLDQVSNNHSLWERSNGHGTSQETAP